MKRGEERKKEVLKDQAKMLKQMINDEDIMKSDEENKKKKPVEVNFLKSRSKFSK